jgi:hypothetical protein
MTSTAAGAIANFGLGPKMRPLGPDCDGGGAGRPCFDPPDEVPGELSFAVQLNSNLKFMGIRARPSAEASGLAERSEPQRPESPKWPRDHAPDYEIDAFGKDSAKKDPQAACIQRQSLTSVLKAGALPSVNSKRPSALQIGRRHRAWSRVRGSKMRQSEKPSANPAAMSASLHPVDSVQISPRQETLPSGTVPPRRDIASPLLGMAHPVSQTYPANRQKSASSLEGISENSVQQDKVLAQASPEPLRFQQQLVPVANTETPAPPLTQLDGQTRGGADSETAASAAGWNRIAGDNQVNHHSSHGYQRQELPDATRVSATRRDDRISNHGIPNATLGTEDHRSKALPKDSPTPRSTQEPSVAMASPVHVNARTHDEAVLSNNQEAFERRHPFDELDRERNGAEMQWTTVSRNRAEAGFEDPTIGWVRVRAHLDGRGVHASVIPGSVEAATALSLHLGDLNSHLLRQHPEVHSVTLSAPSSGWSNCESATEMHQGHGNANRNNNQPASVPEEITGAIQPGQLVPSKSAGSGTQYLLSPADGISGGAHISVLA